MPEFLIPTISDAPILPIRLKLGVARSNVIISTLMPSSSKNRKTPNKGDSKIIGIPVSSQCAKILDSINNGRE